MRYYSIELTDIESGQTIVPSSLGGPITSLSPDGTTNPAALDIEFDLPLADSALPNSQGAHLRIWGLGLEDLGSSFNFNPKQGTAPNSTLPTTVVKIYGGYQAGLPLANPAQAGLLAQGQIQNAFGNWIGTNMTVDMLFVGLADLGAIQAANVALNWKKNTELSDAIRTSLSNAFPDKTLDINISSGLVLPNDENGYYRTIGECSKYFKEISCKIKNDASYTGVGVVVQGDTITVTDQSSSSSSSNTVEIAFQDLIGQPTWMALPEQQNGVQIKCPLRADIKMFDLITLPQTLLTTQPQGMTPVPPYDSSLFTGRYRVIRIHHFGHYRQPDADSWATVIDLVTPPGTT